MLVPIEACAEGCTCMFESGPHGQQRHDDLHEPTSQVASRSTALIMRDRNRQKVVFTYEPIHARSQSNAGGEHFVALASVCNVYFQSVMFLSQFPPTVPMCLNYRTCGFHVCMLYRDELMHGLHRWELPDSVV